MGSGLKERERVGLLHHFMEFIVRADETFEFHHKLLRLTHHMEEQGSGIEVDICVLHTDTHIFAEAVEILTEFAGSSKEFLIVLRAEVAEVGSHLKRQFDKAVAKAAEAFGLCRWYWHEVVVHMFASRFNDTDEPVEHLAQSVVDKMEAGAQFHAGNGRKGTTEANRFATTEILQFTFVAVEIFHPTNVN